MGYYIKVEEVEQIQVWLAEYVSSMSEKLSKVNESVSTIATMQSFEGQAADNVKAYFTEVHGTLSQALSLAVFDLFDKYCSYLGPYTGEIDTSINARFKEDRLGQVAQDLESTLDDIGDKCNRLTNTLNGVSDIFYARIPHPGALETTLSDTAKKPRTLKDRVTEHEQWHTNNFNRLSEVIDPVDRLMARYQGARPMGIDYVPGSLFSDPDIEQLGITLEGIVERVTDNSVRNEELMELICQRFADRAEIEEAKKREDRSAHHRQQDHQCCDTRCPAHEGSECEARHTTIHQQTQARYLQGHRSRQDPGCECRRTVCR